MASPPFNRQYPHRGDAQSLRLDDDDDQEQSEGGPWPMNVDLARIQFAFTSINHFFFVPITIGLAFLTALLQTAWYRSKRDEYLRLTRFFGTLLVINIAIGVVTGLVQEFEFGMNWGAYSRLVGNVFGAPLAMEGLAAFFLESTFLGLWLFGWDRLSRRLHLLTIWAVALGSVLSALFIMAANSWMQHPVGYTMVNGKPQLNDIWALFTNPVFVWGYTKVLLAALTTGAVVMLAVSAWQLRHGGDRDVFSRSARMALIVLLPAILMTMLVGDELGVIEAKYQPMKIAAAEAQWTTCQPCSFSLFQIGGGNNDHTPTQIIEIPHLLSLLATNHWNGQVVGMTPLQDQYSQLYGPGNYVPNVFIQYWGMRVMAYLGVLTLLIALWGLWLVWRRSLATSRTFLWVATWAAVLPFLMNTAGWLLTESGRQPWIVQGIMLTKDGISPTVSVTWLWISLIAFILVYGALGTVDLWLMLRYSRKQLPAPRDQTHVSEPLPAVQY
jgi:cytochrome bd ubiquinol oxidase subunit I